MQDISKQESVHTFVSRHIYALKNHITTIKVENYQPSFSKPAAVYHSVEPYALSVAVLEVEGI